MAKAIIRNAVGRIVGERSCPCSSAMQYAIITDKSVIPDEAKKNLDIIVGKYLS
jgi:5'-methylthioadenosine phosphorylase